MFDITNFQEQLNIFYYMFDSDIDFQKAKKEYINNKFVKSFYDSSYDYEALGDIEITYYSSKSNIFEINVSALDGNIRIEYLVNLTTDEITSNIRLFTGDYADSDKFTKCYNAYENLDSMIIIFIQSNIKNEDEVVNTLIEKLNKNLVSDNIKFDNISYNDINNILFVKTENFEIEVLNFTDFIKGENLYYNINSNNKVDNQTINLINSIVKQIENLR